MIGTVSVKVGEGTANLPLTVYEPKGIDFTTLVSQQENATLPLIGFTKLSSLPAGMRGMRIALDDGAAMHFRTWTWHRPKSRSNRGISISFNKAITNKIEKDRGQTPELLTSRFEPLSLTPREIRWYIKQGHPFCAVLGGDGRRNSANFNQAQHVALDFDGGFSIHEALEDEFITSFAALVYTSPSHTEEQHRFRVLFYLEEPITNPEDYKFLLTGVLRRFEDYGIDASCKDVSRCYYGNTSAEFPLDQDNIRLPTSTVQTIIADERACQAFERRKIQPLPTGTELTSVIMAFNARTDVRRLLESHGYLRKSNDKYLAPRSTSGVPGVTVFNDTHIYSNHSPTSDPLAVGKALDAFDIFRLLERGGETHDQTIKHLLSLPEFAHLKRGLPNEEANNITKGRTAFFPRLVGTNLLDEKLGKVKFIVPNLLPEGLTILAGKQKLGKSWLCLELAVEVAKGGTVLGSMGVGQGRAVYFGLEDAPRRLQDRLKKLVRQKPQLLDLGAAKSLLRLDQGGLDELENYLKRYPDTRLVIIDTLAKVKPPSKSQNAYDEETELATQLHYLALTYEVALVAVTHTTKTDRDDPFDSIRGGGGFVAVADTNIVLTRSRGDSNAKLLVTSREIEEQALALSFDKESHRWKLLGDDKFLNLTEERQNVLNVLGQALQPLHYSEVASKLGEKPDSVKVELSRMQRNGQIRATGGGYFTTLDGDDDQAESADMVI